LAQAIHIKDNTIAFYDRSLLKSVKLTENIKNIEGIDKLANKVSFIIYLAAVLNFYLDLQKKQNKQTKKKTTPKKQN